MESGTELLHFFQLICCLERDAYTEVDTPLRKCIDWSPIHRPTDSPKLSCHSLHGCSRWPPVALSWQLSGVNHPRGCYLTDCAAEIFSKLRFTHRLFQNLAKLCVRNKGEIFTFYGFFLNLGSIRCVLDARLRTTTPITTHVLPIISCTPKVGGDEVEDLDGFDRDNLKVHAARNFGFH